jgi:osmotically-inducible protein OsmY
MTSEKNSDPKDVELESLIAGRIRKMGEHIHVQVKGGVVHLSGATNDFEEKQEITILVQGIGGVHRVVNDIHVAYVSDKY